MDGDFAKLLAGHMGICAVVLNVLIDKGIITQDEFRERFEQARECRFALFRRTSDCRSISLFPDECREA